VDESKKVWQVIGLTFKQKLQRGYVKPLRSKAYLEWVATLPCCGCGQPADEAHHIIAAGLGGGMGTKPSDFMTMPVCRICHDEIHRDSKKWEATNGPQFKHVCLTHEQALDEGIIPL
jgi:hypothetical protein